MARPVVDLLDPDFYVGRSKDPRRVFDRPDEIDFRRHPNSHVAFGLGAHSCLGANLARLTPRVFFEEFSARIAKIEALCPPVHESNVFIKGVTRFDVQLHSRPEA